MPRILDNIHDHLASALHDSLADSVALDACVGYLNLRGWGQLAGSVAGLAGAEERSAVRLLVGMSDDHEADHYPVDIEIWGTGIQPQERPAWNDWRPAFKARLERLKAKEHTGGIGRHYEDDWARIVSKSPEERSRKNDRHQ